MTIADDLGHKATKQTNQYSKGHPGRNVNYPRSMTRLAVSGCKKSCYITLGFSENQYNVGGRFELLASI